MANVLEGSVRKSGNAVRITAQLIRAAEGYHLWSQTYDRKLDDIFKIQDEIAAEVVKQLKVTLLGAAPKARTTDPEAYALYLQARELGRQNNAEAFKKSDALYRQVLAIDPRYAPAWERLARNFDNETHSACSRTRRASPAPARRRRKRWRSIRITRRPTPGSARSRCMATTTSPARRGTSNARWRSIRRISTYPG